METVRHSSLQLPLIVICADSQFNHTFLEKEARGITLYLNGRNNNNNLGYVLRKRGDVDSVWKKGTFNMEELGWKPPVSKFYMVTNNNMVMMNNSFAEVN